MNSEAPILKWTAAAVGVLVVCFCVGYFIVGHWFQGGDTGAAAGPAATPSPVQVAVTNTPSDNSMIVSDVTEATEQKQKAAEAAKAKVAAEEKARADAAAKAKADEDAAAAAARASSQPPADPDASPSPTAPPDAVAASTGDSAPATPAPATPAAAPADSLYRVHVGSFATRDAAKSMASELNGRGYAANVVPDGSGSFRLQLGAFKDRKGADAVQQELKANGYDATVGE